MGKIPGFTLIELTASMVIMAIISVVVGSVLFHGYQAFITSQNISTTDWNGFLALERMADDIHTIRSPNDISVIQSTQLTFVDVNSNSVNYQLSSGSILRNGVTLASGVQSFSMSYLNTPGAITSTASAVRYIVLSVSFTQGNLTQSYVTTVGTRSIS
ncbi:MAG: prepilin-type N-terminal cleavage/methylation domain-containing protein [Gammaproteobacteria bacterium]|nr:MAG: prepilin-type N-terminal cleavage/methylation domain-containing protein [Gammaproteobacteria bacterium]